MSFNLFNFSNLGGVSSIVANPQTDTYTENWVTKQKPQWQIDMEAKQQAPFIPDRSNTLIGKAAQATNEYFKTNPAILSKWPKEIFGGISQGLQNTATSIKNAWYRDAEWMAEQQKSFISDMLAKGYNKETIFKAMDQLKAQGKFQGSISENPITGTLSSIVSAPLQAIWGIASAWEDSARAGELAQEWDTSGAVATFGRGIVKWALGWLGLATWFTPGGAAVNTAFSSDTVAQPLDKYVSAPIRWAVAAWQEYLGYNPNSEGSKALQETAGMVWPLAVLWGAQYWVSKIPNVLTKKVSVPTEWPITKVEPNAIQKFWNARAEQILSSQWKLNKKTKNALSNSVGENGAKFALERDIVGKDIEGTADNAGAYKIQKIQEKIDAVKRFGSTETPEVARNVANTLKNDIITNVKKSYGKNANISEVLMRDNPDIAKVYALADEVANSKKTDYVKLEQLKELHDFLNPEGITYSDGKPTSEVGNLLASGKRSKLQGILEDAGNKNGVDIKWINKDIQWAFALEKGLNAAAERVQNLNIFGLGDTQTAVISAILWGAPGAVGGLLLKKGLSSEGFTSWLARKLYTKTPKNASTNTTNNSVTNPSPISRMGRIMNYTDSTTTPKIIKKALINLTDEKNKAGIIGKPRKKINLAEEKVKLTNKSNEPIQSKSTTPEVQWNSGKPTTKTTPNKEIIGLTEKGGVKNITPGNQVKYNQWVGYEPVRLVLSDKDAQIARYGAIQW